MSGRETRKERKVVTCLFADLVGFTARAESLDPEDVEAILRPYHERLRSELERSGGTVEKFIGDAVNTASRLQAAAPTNGILVDATTYRATERAIEYRDAEAVAAKGKSDPVRVWEPLEARARFGSDVDESQTPLVG